MEGSLPRSRKRAGSGPAPSRGASLKELLYHYLVSCPCGIACTRAKQDGTIVRYSRSVEEDRVTLSYFGEFDSAGRAREDLPSRWEEARKVTSILVDAITPQDHYTADHAL